MKNTSVCIDLSPTDLYLGSLVGCLRTIQDLGRGAKPAYGADNESDWQYSVEGALGEYAVAKHLGLFWNGNVGRLDLPDVGKLQVRTRSKHWYELILHPEDKDEEIFILVTGKNGAYIIRGWIIAINGKLEKYWKEHVKGRPAYFVPQDVLNNMEELNGV